MKPTVYVETTVIGYLTAWPRDDVIIAGHQVATKEWWKSAADRFELVASELVVRECSAGDNLAASDRLKAISNLKLLAISVESERLAAALVTGHAVPKSHPEDALHVALAAANGIEFLVTWNFKHIANAVVRSTIERICQEAGFVPPVICTPEELLEQSDV